MRASLAIVAILAGGFLAWAAFTGVSLPWYGAPVSQQAVDTAFNVAPPLHWNGFQKAS